MEAHEVRLLKEYDELVDRMEKLHKMLLAWERNDLDFEPECEYEQLTAQYKAMDDYAMAIENRNDFIRLKEAGN